MSILNYFKTALPTSVETGLEKVTTKRANESVQNALEGGEKPSAKKPRKARDLYTVTKTEP